MENVNTGRGYETIFTTICSAKYQETLNSHLVKKITKCCVRLNLTKQTISCKKGL